MTSHLATNPPERAALSIQPPSPPRPALPEKPPVPEPKRLEAPVRQAAPNRRDWLFRLVIVLLLASSATLAWWSFKYRLLPLQKQAKELSQTVARVSAQVDDLERHCAARHPESVTNRLRQAHAKLFADQVALEKWLSYLRHQAEPLALETKAEFGQTIPLHVADEQMTLIPTTVLVTARPAGQLERLDSPYRRLLQFSEKLAAQGKRADLTELKVVGGTNSVTGAVLVFNLWAGEDETP